MSRILKAPYVTIDNNNYFSIDNTLNIPEEIKEVAIEEKEEIFGESASLSLNETLEIEQR